MSENDVGGYNSVVSIGLATGRKVRGLDSPRLSGLALGPTQPPIQWVLGLSQG